MVAIMNNESFERSKEFFEEGNIRKTIENYETAISHLKSAKNKNQADYIQFLEKLLTHTRENNLKEEEALVLRAMGRTYSIFKKHVESLKFHWEALKIQRKLGKKLEVAEGLVFLAEDIEVSGNYDECIKTFQDAEKVFHELGKLRRVKEIKKEISRLQEFSKEILETEYYLHKFGKY